MNENESVEVFAFTDDSERIHTDFIKSIDCDITELPDFMPCEIRVMDYEEYCDTILANTCNVPEFDGEIVCVFLPHYYRDYEISYVTKSDLTAYKKWSFYEVSDFEVRVNVDNFDVSVYENDELYFIDFHTGDGVGEYKKEDWDIIGAIKDQCCIPSSTEEVANKEGYDLVDTTEGINGYPKNCGLAMVGFESYRDAEAIAETYDGDVVLLHKRDGWNMWEKRGELREAVTLSLEDVDYEFGVEFTPRDSNDDIERTFDELVDGLEEEDAATMRIRLSLLKNDIHSLNEDEVIFAKISDCGELVWETFDKHPIQWSYDTHNYQVGVVI